MDTHPAHNIVIVGSGFGGLETALYLRRHLGDQVHVTLVSDSDTFTFRPYLTYVPFGLTLKDVQLDIQAITQAQGIVFRAGRVHDHDPSRKEIRVNDEPLAHDYLVIATGAAAAPEPVPGLYEHAFTLWLPDDMKRLQDAFQQVLRAVEAGTAQRVVFVVPPGCSWAGPLYEMVFMLETWLHWKNARDGVDLSLVTPEARCLGVLSPKLHRVIAAECAHRGISLYTEQTVHRVEAGVLTRHGAEPIPYDLLIAALAYQAAATWPGLPADERGFLHTNPTTCQVQDHPDIYAVGDASDSPLKQAYLALLQADAAAEHLVARLRGTEPAFAFEPRPRWLMEQFDQALFTQVESETAPIEMERLPVGEFRRMLIAAHLPRQYGANPLYAGLFWKGTQVGLNVLNQLLP